MKKKKRKKEKKKKKEKDHQKDGEKWKKYRGNVKGGTLLY
jgi:hypothetical protein